MHRKLAPLILRANIRIAGAGMHLGREVERCERRRPKRVIFTMPDTHLRDLRTVRAHLWGISYDFSTLSHPALQTLESMSRLSTLRERLSLFCVFLRELTKPLLVFSGLYWFVDLSYPVALSEPPPSASLFFVLCRKTKNQPLFCA